MQFQKEDVRARIIDAARDEFGENGFERASIRKITATANTSKSNVYNYFHDKNALFVAVVEPTLLEIRSGIEKLKDQNSGTSVKTYSMIAQKNVVMKIMEFVFEHDADLKLLLFHSSGSSLSDFKAHVTQSLADLLTDWVYHAAPDKGISEFFIYTVAGFYIGAIEQMLAQCLSKEQEPRQFEVFLRFIYGGWNTVLSNNIYEE